MHHQPQQQTTASVHANSNSTSTAPLPLQGSSSLTDANNSSNKFAIVDLTDEVKLKTQFKGDKLLKVNKQFRSNSEFQSNYFFFKTKKRKGASTASSEPTPNSDDEIESELNHAQHFYNEKSISQNPESNLKRRNTICMVQTSISTSAVGGQQHQQQHQQQQHNIDMMMNPTKANTSLQGDHSVSPKRQGPQHLARAQSFSFPQEYYSGPRNKSSHQHHQSMPILNNQAFNVQLNGNGNTIQSGHNNSNYYNHDNIYTPTKIIRLKKDVPQTPIMNTENDMNSHQLFHLTRNDQLGSSRPLSGIPSRLLLYILLFRWPSQFLDRSQTSTTANHTT
ncbi:hypothetical protein C9374_006236 [Naegleria lovaniensis]|uniref:Uncharacterized protein n=1 Tax=Naegleria lovaniensis TaxID=51637 RepID=A0AA88GP14_NAELO|nr:uncharacterized protein C9374_006236 [Naegleria lovaniensis]KAG2381852.1 hypothetical protein C9374_006236 [Naegleria lovaniensis]